MTSKIYQCAIPGCTNVATPRAFDQYCDECEDALFDLTGPTSLPKECAAIDEEEDAIETHN